MYLFINFISLKFCSTLNRASVTILVIPDSPEIWWRKRDSKVNFFKHDVMMTAATERLFNAWIQYYARIRCKNRVNARRWIFCKMGWLVNNLTITRSQCNGIKLLSNIVTSIERIPLWKFSFEISSNYWDCWIETINAIQKKVKSITKGLKLFMNLARRPI